MEKDNSSDWQLFINERINIKVLKLFHVSELDISECCYQVYTLTNGWN
jgi:hypothetical protein